MAEKYRYIIADVENMRLTGTDLESFAREQALELLVYDTETGMALGGYADDEVVLGAVEEEEPEDDEENDDAGLGVDGVEG